MMKRDISNRSDIEKLVTCFYEKIKRDSLLSVFFLEVITVDWEKHNRIMVDFWDNVLFFTGKFEGNPLNTHRELFRKKPTKKLHFDRWFQIFDSTVDEHYAGPNTEKLKAHARSIGEIMQQMIKN